MRKLERPLLPFMLLAMLSGSAPAAETGEWRGASPLPDSVARQVMPPVAYSLPGADRVRVTRDISYLAGAGPEVLMDIYRPQAKKGLSPAVLLIHGSTDVRYRPKDWGFFQSWGRLIAASGLAAVVFTLDLPRSGPQLAAGSASVSAAMDFIGSHGRRLGIDPDRVCLMAFSAGGPLIAPYLRGANSAVRCIAAYYPLLDTADARFYFRWDEALPQFSPILRLADDGPKVPLLVARGGKDELPGLRTGIDRFVAKALETNWPLTLLNHPGGGHGFDNQSRDRRTAEIVADTLAFFTEHLGRREPPRARTTRGR